MVDYGDNQFVTLLYGDTWFATLLYRDSWFLYCTMYLTDVRCVTPCTSHASSSLSLTLASPLLYSPPTIATPFPSFSFHLVLPFRHHPLTNGDNGSVQCTSNITHPAAQRLPHWSWSWSSAPPSIDLWHNIITIHLHLTLLHSHPSPPPLVSSTCDTLPFPSSLCSHPSSNPFHWILTPLQNAMNHSPHPRLASTAQTRLAANSCLTLSSSSHCPMLADSQLEE
ncbi:hypothetical protein F5148DRAFT_1225927 [Russula earlei]|uniref:Uncharacterized protein n=1 Tax=Russula earlei TaxID=71964 RepID=A0ACC0U039_9AGAM|nr:hypothetical protein F5148DRAFT_1225927 [Russula earlei]